MASVPLILIALVSISVLVLVHELGHFIVAKWLGVWPEEFGIGLPPKLWGKKIGETIYSVNALPIGGFVRLHGETEDGHVAKPKRAFVNQAKWKKVVISVAGVIMNFLLAIIFFTVIFWFNGVSRGVKIVEVLPESPAAVAGLKLDDEIIKVADRKIVDTDTFSDIIADFRGQKIEVDVLRIEKEARFTKTLEVYVRSESPANEGLLGIIYSSAELYYPKLWQRPFVLLYYGIKKTIFISEKITVGMGLLFQQAISGQIPEGVAGPVGVTALVAEFARLGILPLMEFMAVISINLALLNLVPFPPLDGSRVLFVAIEALFGRKILPKIESFIQTAGMAVLLLLMLALTANEIPKLLTAGSLSKFVESLLQ